MAPTIRLPPKKDVALALLEQSPIVDVLLDPRIEGVVVPAWFKKQPQLKLQIGLNLQVPIHDLHVDDDALSGTLSFNRTPFFCKIPWNAVFALIGTGERAAVWPDDIPAEVAAQSQMSKPAPKPRPALHTVPAEAKAPDRAKKAETTKKKRAKRAKPKARPEALARAEEPRAEVTRQAAEASPRKPAAAQKSPAAARKKRELPPYLRIVK